MTDTKSVQDADDRTGVNTAWEERYPMVTAFLNRQNVGMDVVYRHVLAGDATTEQRAMVVALAGLAIAMKDGADWESSCYDAQSPVEDWLLDAVEQIHGGDADAAARIWQRFDSANWEPDGDGVGRSAYVWVHQHDKGHEEGADPNCVHCVPALVAEHNAED